LGASMTSAVTGLAITPTPVFAINAGPPMTAGGMGAPGEARAGVAAAARGSMPDAQETELTKTAQLGVPVPNALLSLFIANAPIANAPDGSPSAVSAYLAVDTAASSQEADIESAGSNSDSSGDSNTNSRSLNGAYADLQATSNAPQHKTQGSGQPVRIIPHWHIRPKMKTA
jgi:hypothetical protein